MAANGSCGMTSAAPPGLELARHAVLLRAAPDADEGVGEAVGGLRHEAGHLAAVAGGAVTAWRRECWKGGGMVAWVVGGKWRGAPRRRPCWWRATPSRSR
jgi:hypothetical protein